MFTCPKYMYSFHQLKGSVNVNCSYFLTLFTRNRVVSLEVTEEQMIVIVTFDINEGNDGMENEGRFV